MFNILKTNETDQLIAYTLSGSITENANFSGFSAPGKSEIHLDLEQLKSINSVGIRSFKSWIYELPAQNIFLFKCPKVFVDQLNMVHDFLPPSARVRSFYVPFYHPDTNEEQNVLYIRGDNYKKEDDGRIVIKHSKPRGASGQNLELDVEEKRYFKFLSAYA